MLNSFRQQLVLHLQNTPKTCSATLTVLYKTGLLGLLHATMHLAPKVMS